MSGQQTRVFNHDNVKLKNIYAIDLNPEFLLDMIMINETAIFKWFIAILSTIQNS